MKMERKVEILAPAGSYESMMAAVNAGADAVYIGGNKFGARAYANNLDEEAMVRAIDFVHMHGRRLYMTVNTLMKERELSELYDYLLPYYRAGLDAVIVQDLGVFSYIREAFPDLPLHVSTQMTVTGPYSAADLKAMGASRVVPARELSLEEIKRIADTTGMEIETFVHGALCYCYSGQCLFSSLIGGRSGNRGRCAQTCRLPFDVLRGKKQVGKPGEKYVLSLKDLCTLDILPDILEAGVCSLKIEGRMKSPRYTAGVVSVYRKYVDKYLANGRRGYRVDPADRELLLELFDRGGQTQGYYRQHNGRDMVVLREKPSFREVDQGLMDELDRRYVNTEKKIHIRGLAKFAVGKPCEMEIWTSDGDVEAPLQEECGKIRVCVLDDAAQEAVNAPMSAERIEKQLGKTGDSPFVFDELRAEIDGNVFVPVQVLNRLRRQALQNLTEEMLKPFRREEKERPGSGAGDVRAERTEAGAAAACPRQNGSFPEFAVLVNTEDQLDAALSCIRKWKSQNPGQIFGVYLASEEFSAKEWEALALKVHGAGARCYLMMPRIFRSEAERYFRENLSLLRGAAFDALGVGAMEEPGFLREVMPGTELYFDQGMYAANGLAERMMREYGAKRTTIPLELNAKEIAAAGLRGELIVYGYLPMMVSAQCIRKTEEGCVRKPELLWLKDRKGKEFPVRNQCRFCYNTIYNAAPLSLLGLSGEIRKLHPAALRLNFTIESGKKTAEILSAFYNEFVLAGKRETLPGEFTRGHFKRGVE